MAKKKVSTEETVTTPAPAPVNTAVTRIIELEPEDWVGVPWKPRPSPSKDAVPPAPFDLPQSIDLLTTKVVPQKKNDSYKWEKVHFPAPMSREEAHFWVIALTEKWPNNSVPKTILKTLSAGTYDGTLSFADIRQRIKDMERTYDYIQLGLLWDVLPVLLTPQNLIDLILDEEVMDSTNAYYMVPRGIQALAERSLPFAEPKAVEQIRKDLKPKVVWSAWANPSDEDLPPVFAVAAAVGMPDEILDILRRIPDDHAKDEDWMLDEDNLQRLVFGLGSPALVESEFRRLNMQLTEEKETRAFLARTEFNALDVVRDGVLGHGNAEAAKRLAQVFGLVKAPETAPFMLELKLNSKASGTARTWLDTNVGLAVSGLLSTATGRGKLAEAALDYLREVKRKGMVAVIEEQLKSAPPEVADKIRRTVLEHTQRVIEPFDEKNTPEWLTKALTEQGADKAKLPPWVEVARLPPLIVGENQLNEAQVTQLLLALKKSALKKPEPLAAAVRKNAEKTSLEAFAWRLFELWQEEGTPPKEKWTMTSLGILGGDAVVMKLTPFVKKWPGESQHQRAVHGLECLREIGSDTALMQLNGIAQKLKFQGLKAKATAFIEEICKDKGLTRDQLEDRIIPSLDLDERGSRTFDFGPRQFKFVLSGDLAPMIRDDAGKVKGELPKPNAKDDATKANAAVAEWKLVKKQLKEVFKVQADRLEKAMTGRRRWSAEEFGTLLVHHPLMINLVRRVIWGSYKGRELQQAFRVTEEFEYVNANEDPVSLEGAKEIGVVHPVEMSDEDRGKWGEVLTDYELIAPFPQLGRPISRVLPEEVGATEITRFKDVKVQGIGLWAILKNTDWGSMYVTGYSNCDVRCKYHPSGDVTAVIVNEPGLHDSGYGYGAMDFEEQTITSTFFLKGDKEDWNGDKKKMLKLETIDALTFNEVMRILHAAAAKGK